MRPPVIFIDTPTKAKKYMDELASQGDVEVAVDTEFDPDPINGPRIVLMSYSWSKGIRRVVQGDLVKDYFGEWLSDPKTRLVYQNFKADKEVFDGLEIDTLASYYADVMVMGWLHDETLISHGLKYQSFHFLHWQRKEYQKLFVYVPYGKSRPIVMPPSTVLCHPPDDALAVRTAEEWFQLMLDYSGDDAESTIALFHHHKAYLEGIGYWKNYLRYDKPFTTLLMACEDRGVTLDQERLREILRSVGATILRCQHCYRAAAGNPELNLNSGPQMKKLLIGEWGWPVREDLVTPTGEPKLDKEAMTWWAEEHGYALAEVKQQYNGARTLQGTFLEGLLNGVSDDGRLRTDFVQIGCDTGRISSRKNFEHREEEYTTKRGDVKTRIKKVKVGANLQNIPSRPEKDPYGIRDAFVAPSEGDITASGDIAEEDYVLIVGDYSGFELCMAIHWASQLVPESPMLKIMQQYKSPSACHAFTAIKLYEDAEAEIDGVTTRLGDLHMDDWTLVKKHYPSQYMIAKNNNFNLLYGGSAKMMARLRGMDFRDQSVLDDCQEQMDAWNTLYSEIGVYQRHMVKHGYKHGWVPTLAGRRSNVKDLLADPDPKERAHGERKCMNSPCQGCIHPKTKILTKEFGVVSIETVDSQHVTVWDGTRWSKAQVLSSGKKSEVLITFYGGLQVRCSPDHRFWVANSEGRVSWKTPDQFAKQQYVVLTEAASWSASQPWPETVSMGNGAKDVSVNVLTDYEQGLFVGRVASDGWICKDKSVRLIVAEHEKVILPRLRFLAKKLGRYVEHTILRPTQNRRPLYHIEIHSTALARQLASVKGSIPTQIWESRNRLRGYLRGLFDGDGTVSADGASLCFGGGHRYESWAREVQQALFLLGIRSRLVFRATRIDVLVQKADSCIFSKVVGFINPKKQKKLEAIHARYEDKSKYGRVLHVQSVTLTGKHVPMYDVVNSVTGRFTANGVVTHNSAADIVKAAMLFIEQSEELCALGYRQLFPVHDEIVGECPKSTAQEAQDIVTKLMKKPFRHLLSFELAIECKYANTWQKAK